MTAKAVKKLNNPNWTVFTQEEPLQCDDGPQARLARDQADQTYLALWTDSFPGFERWVYVPVEEGEDSFPRPNLREALTGRRPLVSVIGNADEVYVVDVDPEGNFTRTVRARLHEMTASDIPFSPPGPEARLNVPERVIAAWERGKTTQP